MAVLIVLLFIFLSSIDIIPLYHEKMWKEMAVHSLFMFINLSLALALVLGVEVVNPTDIIEIIFKPLSPLK